MRITYGIHKTPFGLALIAIEKQKVIHLSFIDPNKKSTAINNSKKIWPEAEIVRRDTETKKYIKDIFSTKKSIYSKKLIMQGTDFQRKVWKALLGILFGKTSTYAEIAKKVGSPKAVRAVGSACGKNAIAFLIPCHRVLTSTGKIGGYRWGTKRKEALLAWERKLSNAN